MLGLDIGFGVGVGFGFGPLRTPRSPTPPTPLTRTPPTTPSTHQVKAIRSSAYALGVPFFFLGVAVVLFATLVFYLERLEVMSNIISCDRPTICTGLDLTYGVDKQTCDGLCLPDGYELVFASIPEAIWFMVVTMTTVGYGDVSPTSTVGKIIASMGAVFGVLFLAMPLAIVGENFTSIWGDKEKVLVQARAQTGPAGRGRRDVAPPSPIPSRPVPPLLPLPLPSLTLAPPPHSPP